jgi:regulator of sigma E protease
VFKAPGATILAINGVSVATFAEIREALRATTKPNSKEPTTVSVRLRRFASTGGSASDADEVIAWTISPKDIAAVHALGWASPISPGAFKTEEVLLKASSPADALRMGFIETRRVMLSTYSTFVRLYQGTVKVEHLKGPVGIAHLGTLVAGRGFIWLLFFLALISVNLAVVNFLPLPIVDGGQFLFLVFEQLRGKPAPLAVQSAATLAGLVLIGCVFLLVTYNDIRTLLGF